LALLVLAFAATLPAPAAAQGALGTGIARFEERVDEAAGLAARKLEETPVLGELARRVRISGSVIGAWFDAQDASQVTAEHWLIWDARLFVDALLAEELGPAETPWLRAVGVSFEWEQRRIGERVGEVGELYLDLQGIADSSWLNLHVGRFQLPVGEAYLRYGKGVVDDPFLTDPVGATWWWDEGFRLHGSGAGGRVGYVASLTEGRTPRDWHFDRFESASLKLFADPWPWLHLSASVLRTGSSGDADEPASVALWLGESWARGFGAGAPGPNVMDGRVVPDGPGRLDGTLFTGVDAVLEHPAGARLWLAFGRYRIDSSGPGLYDRTLVTWTAELRLEGRLLSPELRRFFAALRASHLGTTDAGEGYLLDVRTTGRFGYNARSLQTVSVALGWRVTRWTDLRFEYTAQRFDLARGAEAVLGRGPGRDDFVALALGVHF
jgi:hypothetical protein